MTVSLVGKLTPALTNLAYAVYKYLASSPRSHKGLASIYGQTQGQAQASAREKEPIRTPGYDVLMSSVPSRKDHRVHHVRCTCQAQRCLTCATSYRDRTQNIGALKCRVCEVEYKTLINCSTTCTRTHEHAHMPHHTPLRPQSAH